MFSITTHSNIGDEIKRLGADIHRHPLAIAKAMTFTAQDVKQGEVSEMRRSFDRPTPFTVNSLLVKPATAASLEAHVWFRDLGASRKSGGAATHYLEPQVFGGDRPLKRFEKYLQRAGFMPVGMAAAPGERAQLDSHGNMSRGQLIQILSALRALPERGYLANRSAASAARRAKSKRPRALVNYFVGRPNDGLPLGVWERVGTTGLRPVLIFVKAPRYQKRFAFFETAQRIATARFPGHLTRAIARDGTAGAAGSFALSA